MNKLLFSKGELRVALELEAKRVRDAVESVPDEHLLQVDVDEWADALAEQFEVACPDLHVDAMYRDPVKEVKVDVSSDPGRYFSPYTTDRRIAGYQIVVRVPFTGDKTVFELRPSTFTYNPPLGRIDGNELVMTVEYAHDAKPDIDAEVNSFVGTVQHWLGFAQVDIASFNGALGQTARQTIIGRQTRIRERDEHLAASSIPVGRPTLQGKTYIAEAIIRRPAPKLASSATNGVQVALEPVLEDKIFEHILWVVRMQAVQMEQSPKTYVQMDEEARRDLFVATLNTHYEGRGTAEAFNVSGKTS